MGLRRIRLWLHQGIHRFALPTRQCLCTWLREIASAETAVAKSFSSDRHVQGGVLRAATLNSRRSLHRLSCGERRLSERVRERLVPGVDNFSLRFVQKALCFAMSRDGSSGGVVRTLVITKDKAGSAFYYCQLCSSQFWQILKPTDRLRNP